ncbi:YSIRK signal domain/LPXTG anchor domain surface protein, partial [Limosilactobacillus reuteri]
AQTVADQAIDKATTNAAVTEAQTNGVNAINGIKVPTTSATKEQAITDLNTAVDDAKKAIDQDNNLTNEQKQAAKDQINSDAKTAQDAINNAKTNDDVKKAAADGTLAIDKDVANAAIDNAVAGKKAEISNSPLTDEEKTALNNEVAQKANSAREAINNATTPEAVATAQEDGVKNITDTEVPSESAAKQAAKKAVAKAADEKNTAIDSSNLTDEEKAALKQKVTDAQNAADQAIDNAKTNAAVTEAKDKGIKNINDIDVPSKSDAKEKAVTDLNTAVENAKKAIDQDSNLTDEQKQAAKDQIDSDAKTAQEAINNAKTDNDVNNAVNSGKVSIDKDVANAAIDNAVAGKLKEIQDPLTTEEKQAYTDLINSEANNAKQNIANATTVEEVTTAQTNGVNEINNTGIPTTSSAKEKAIAAINDALQTKTDEINNASNINTQEKTDLINQATEAANAAKNNINNATTNTDVDTAQTNGEKAIADVTVPNLSDVKKESIDLINKALDAKTDEINNASNLSQDEKQGLINTATNAATEAINNVNQAQTNDDAKAAATTGVQNIENITIPTLDEAKKNANQAIDDALNSKVNEINNASNLNETEKQKLVDQANEAAATAKNNVENATTNDDARDAANAGIDNIKGITFTSLEDAKNAANTAIDNALQVKTDEINNASNLSTDEKQDLINQATEVAKNAKDNINNATTNDAVTEAQNKGIADIANVTVPSLDQVKQDAINAIKQVQDAKNKQISAASNLSAEEQKELTDQVDKIANDAIAKINDAATTTNDAVNATRDDAIKQITDLFIPTLDGAQTDAINAIESAKNAKLNDINNAAYLTDQEKQALVDQTNKAADEATKAIKAAQTNDEVKSAETAGLDNINNITIPTLVQKQQEAIEELNAARDAKNSAIDNAADLTTDEKNALKDKVQVEYSNAVSNITSATTDEAVTTAKEDGITAIKDIQIPTKSPTKEQATSDLTTAVDEAKNAIDQDSNLTDEEKQAAKDQIDSDAQKAQEAIDNAKTADEVKTAVDNGQLAIDKDVANAAIDNAVAGKKAEISKSPLTDEEKTALNNEVDQKAQDAKEAINNATTPEAVTTAQENGIKNITNTEVPTESTAKEAAKKAIAEAAEAKNNAIDSSNLTDEEKAALKQEVTDAQNAADKAIDNATTNAAVTEAEDNGIKAINGIEIPAKSPAKEQATTDLNDAVDDAKKAIDQDSNLTDAEKQAAKDQIDSDAKKAQEAIDNAKTDDEVKTAVDNGQLAIDKDVANAAIDNAVAGKKAEIAKAPLTTDEANALNDLVDQEAKVAKNAIDSATTIPAVEDAKNTGVAAINDIAVPTTSSTKDQANQTIDDALANKIKEINDATNLSDKQKQDLIDQANNAANTAKDNITKATSDSEVATATTDGIDAIANVTVPSLETAKDQAKDLIDDVLNEKKNEINNADNLSDSQKQDLINQATDEADQAKKNIDNATTNNDVQTAEDNGAQAIENVTVPSLDEAKKASTKVIDEVLKEKTAEINAATNLSNAEKDALIKDATTAANTAKDNIAKATTNDAVKDAETDGVKAILDIKVPGREDQQKDAIAALDRALADKVSEIDNANNLSETTKQDLKQQAQAAYTTAVDNVNNAQTSAEINAARDNGIQAILDITVPTLTDAQDASITAVEQVRDAKKTQIEAAKNLTETQKEALKNQVDEIADKAIDNIKNATTDATVKDAETAGINEILNVTIPTLDAAKSDAKQAIADALTAKTAEINAAQNLTDAEKQKLIDQAQTEAAAANKNIDAATTNDAAELAAKNGVQAILDIQVPTVEETRDQAKKNVDNALNSKKEEINNSNLSPAAKEALINEAEQAAENARTAIDNATTASAISEAEAAGIAAIENIKVSNAPTESDNPSNNQTNTETPTESNSTSQNNNNATQAPVQGNNTQTDLTGSHGTNLTTGQQTEKAADTNSKETLPQTGNETERGLSIAGLAIASLLGLFGLSGLGKKRD